MDEIIMAKIIYMYIYIIRAKLNIVKLETVKLTINKIIMVKLTNE
jgi:hypothetical protein